MTRKDFVLLANAVADMHFYADDYVEGPGGTVKLYVAEALAEALATTNPRFDRERFIKAATS